jgi:hypothetical protein
MTIHQMADVLDTIADHLVEKDPAAKKLFHMESDEASETSMVMAPIDESKVITINVPMNYNRDYSSTKRLHGNVHSTTLNQMQVNHDPDNPTTPNKSPPAKRKKSSSSKTLANPEGIARARGET